MMQKKKVMSMKGEKILRMNIEMKKKRQVNGKEIQPNAYNRKKEYKRKKRKKKKIMLNITNAKKKRIKMEIKIKYW